MNALLVPAVVSALLQRNNVEALACLAVLYMRHTNFAEMEGVNAEAAAKKAATDGFVLLQVCVCVFF